jgi:hypothetical protein
MRITKFFVGGLAVILAVSVAAAQGQRKIAVLDNCDPDDPAWSNCQELWIE